MFIPSGRVDEDTILRLTTLQIRLCRFVPHLDAGMQDLEIMPRQIAQLGLPFHVVGLLKPLRYIIGVDAQAAGEVGKRTALQQTGFVFRAGFRRALLDGEVGGEEQVVVVGPLRRFFLQELPGGNLTQRQRNVSADGRLLQGERRHVGVQVSPDILSCYIVQDQIFFRFITSRSVRKRHSPRGSLYLSRPANITRSSLVTS